MLDEYRHAPFVYRRAFAGALTTVSCQFFGRDRKLNDGTSQADTSILFQRRWDAWEMAVEALTVQLFAANSNPINGVLVQLGVLADQDTIQILKQDFSCGYGSVAWNGLVHSRWAFGYVLPAYTFSAGDFVVFTASVLDRGVHDARS